MSALDYWHWITGADRKDGRIRRFKGGDTVYYLCRPAARVFTATLVRGSASKFTLDAADDEVARTYYGEGYISADPTHVYDNKDEAMKDLFKLKLEGKLGTRPKPNSPTFDYGS